MRWRSDPTRRGRFDFSARALPGGTDLDDAQLERARAAFWLVIETAPETEAAWKALRRALRLSRADDEWLRAHVPGVVRKGARVDLLPVRDRVQEAGQSASVVERSDP